MRLGISAVGATLLLLTSILVADADEAAVDSASVFSYVGSKKCKICHIKQYKSWEQTTMAKTFEVLMPGARAEEKKAAGLDPEKDYTADAECLPCHTVGYGKPGGFVDLATTPTLAGVGCEMCHGPGSEYLKKEHMSNSNKEYVLAELEKVGLVGKPKAETCTSICHNDESPFVEKGYVFDFENEQSEGTHEHRPLKYKHE